MRILVNAVSLKEGGSRVVLHKLQVAMQAIRPDIEWIVAINPKLMRYVQHQSGIDWRPIEWIDRSPFHLIGWYELVLPEMIKKFRPDVLFSQTNYLPRRPLKCPTVLLIQHAGHFSPVFDRLMQASLPSAFDRFLWRQKRRWVYRSAKAANLLTVQTQALADAVNRETGRPLDSIAVIPHGPGQVERTTSPHSLRSDGPFRIGYITRFGVQKNFLTLFRACRILADTGHRLKLVLSLDESDPANHAVLASAEQIGILSLIENNGEVGSNVGTIYDSLDIFVFPSLCESLGLPMVEAMAHGLPVVIADIDSNIEVTRGAGVRFLATDAEALADTLARLMKEPAERAKWSALSLTASKSYSWDKAADQTLRALQSVASPASAGPFKQLMEA